MGLIYYQQGHVDASLEAHGTALSFDPFYMLDKSYKNHLGNIEEELGKAKTFYFS